MTSPSPADPCCDATTASGQLPGYRFGRVIRLTEHEVDAFIEHCRIAPGTLDHLYPEPVGHEAD